MWGSSNRYIEQKIAKREKQSNAEALVKVMKYFSEPRQLIGRWVKIWTVENEPFVNGKVTNIEWDKENAIIVLQRYDGYEHGYEEKLSDEILRITQNTVRGIQPYTILSTEMSNTLSEMLNDFCTPSYMGRSIKEKPTGLFCPLCKTEIVLWACNTQWGYKCQAEDCLKATCYGF